MRFCLGATDRSSLWYSIVGAPVPKKWLHMAGIEDCYTLATGQTTTFGNFAKAMYAAIAKTYGYLTADLWKETVFSKSPFQEFTDFLMKKIRCTRAPVNHPNMYSEQLTAARGKKKKKILSLSPGCF